MIDAVHTDNTRSVLQRQACLHTQLLACKSSKVAPIWLCVVSVYLCFGCLSVCLFLSVYVCVSAYKSTSLLAFGC